MLSVKRLDACLDPQHRSGLLIVKSHSTRACHRVLKSPDSRPLDIIYIICVCEWGPQVIRHSRPFLLEQPQGPQVHRETLARLISETQGLQVHLVTLACLCVIHSTSQYRGVHHHGFDRSHIDPHSPRSFHTPHTHHEVCHTHSGSWCIAF